MSDSCTCSCSSARRPRRRPTATFVIATLALFMSLGGTSYAAVKAKSIGSKQLKSHSVTSAKLARNAVTASAIRAGVIDGSKIRAGSIGSQHVIDGSIGAQDLAPNSIGSGNIAPGSVGVGQIAANSIGPGQIADKSVGPTEIDDATIKLFRDVPTEISSGGGQNVESEQITNDSDGFTTMRSSTITDLTGTTLVQSSVWVFSGGGDAVVSCWVDVNGTPRGTSTVTVSGRVAIPVNALTRLTRADVVQTRCRVEGSQAVFADTRRPGATSMTLMRVGS